MRATILRKMLINNKFEAQTLTGNPTGNSCCHALASRALNKSCSFGQSGRWIESRCIVTMTTQHWCLIKNGVVTLHRHDMGIIASWITGNLTASVKVFQANITGNIKALHYWHHFASLWRESNDHCRIPSQWIWNAERVSMSGYHFDQMSTIWNIFLIFMPWWHHQMEKCSALLAIGAGNSPGTGEFPTQMPVTRSLDVFFDPRPNKRLRKQWWGWWFEMPSNPLWRYCNALYNQYTIPMHFSYHSSRHTNHVLNDAYMLYMCIYVCKALNT